MTLDHPTAAPAAARPDGNDVDAAYLEEAVAALASIMSASADAASRSDARDVRVLAGDALRVQTAQLTTISACLLARGRPHVRTPRRSPGTSPAPHGVAGDRSFVAQLTAHTHASLTAARIEMISGSSHAVRPIAEMTIHDQDRQLAALVLHAHLRGVAADS